MNAPDPTVRLQPDMAGDFPLPAPLPLPFRGAGAQIQGIEFEYRRAPDHGAAPPAHHPVVVVGAGPVGLSLAIDLAQRGQPVVVLDNDYRLSSGSRAICFAKRTLEIWDRLGVGARMVEKGVSWSVGRVFFGDSEVYQFDLLPEPGHERPAFINLQQYYAEAYLVERAMQLPLIDLRWRSTVTAIEQDSNGATLTVETPDGSYQLTGSYIAACDGSRSPLRQMMGLETQGRTFKDRFLIADVRMDADFQPQAGGDPSTRIAYPVLSQSKDQALRQAQDDRIDPLIPQGERGSNKRTGLTASRGRGTGFAGPQAQRPPRGAGSDTKCATVGAQKFQRWFWFDPPFHRNQSVLLHRQPDNIWRIDFQLGWDADPEFEKRPENIIPRVKALLGNDAQFELEWASVYTFACQRMARFVHDRVIFLGDAAHGVSPFGARGANSGVQDAENLAWKLDLVLRGKASAQLIDSYGSEREYAADENILNSTRATDFITPKSEISHLFRSAVLDLAREHAFARRIVNSGRLSVPAVLAGSALNTLDTDAFDGPMMPGAPAADAPIERADQSSWLLRQLGAGFTLLVFGSAPAWAANLPLTVLAIGSADEPNWHDTQGWLSRRYDARPGTAYLIRPDQHISARWRAPTQEGVHAALQTACALSAHRSPTEAIA